MRDRLSKWFGDLYIICLIISPITTLILAVLATQYLLSAWVVVLLLVPTLIIILVYATLLLSSTINYFVEKHYKKKNGLNSENRKDIKIKTKFLTKNCSDEEYKGIDKINMLSVSIINSKKEWSKNYDISINDMCNEIMDNSLKVLESHNKSLSSKTVVKEEIEKKFNEKGGK